MSCCLVVLHMCCYVSTCFWILNGSISGACKRCGFASHVEHAGQSVKDSDLLKIGHVSKVITER